LGRSFVVAQVELLNEALTNGFNFLGSFGIWIDSGKESPKGRLIQNKGLNRLHLRQGDPDGDGTAVRVPYQDKRCAFI